MKTTTFQVHTQRPVTRIGAVVRRYGRSLASGLVALLGVASSASAHTVSYGYVPGTQPGQYTFWFGTYHTGVNYTEGQIQLTCGGGYSATTSFTSLVLTRPAGLVAGTNYFYDAGYGGEVGSPLFATTPTHTAGSLTGAVAGWQGVTFNNITYPGTCTFKYIPIAVPTQTWDPGGANGTLKGIGSGSFVLTGGVTITKTSTTTKYATVGQVIPYSYAVQNTGNMVLTVPMTVADNKAPVTCDPFTALTGTSPVIYGLASGATLMCRSSYTVTQADIDAGSLTNTATAKSGTSTTPYTSPVASLTIPADQKPAMTVVKKSTTVNFSAPNVVIPYTYLITNTGNTTLKSAISIVDNKIPTVICDPIPSTGLAPGGAINCAGTYTTTQADVDAGGVTNAAFSKSGATVSPTVNVSVPSVRTPSMTFAKTTTATGFATLGQTIPYQFTVINTGNTSLVPLTVSDPKVPGMTCPPLPATGLAPGGTYTCSGTYAIKQPDLDSGTLTNTASVASGTLVVAPSTVTIPGTKSPSIKLAKATTANTFSAENVSIPYTFTVTNTGNTTITSAISVADTKIPSASIVCPANPSPGLAPGASLVCNAIYKTTQADLDAGSIVNSATASTTIPGTGPGTGPISSPPDLHTLPATQTHTLKLAKSGLPANFSATNTSIIYTYVITNTGNTTIPTSATLTIADDKLGTIACPAVLAPIPPLGTHTCTKSYQTTQADIDAGSITNHATATDGLTTSPSVSFTVSATQTNALSTTKDTVPSGQTYSAIGDVLVYNFIVTNTGNTTQTTPITITDTKIASVTCPALPTGGLPPAPALNSSLTCSGTYTIKQSDLDAGSVVNSAFAKSGTTTSTPPATHTAPADKKPALTVVKSSGSVPFTGPNVTLSYSYLVTNAGNVTLTSAVTVADDKIPTVTCNPIPAGGLAPLGFVTCTGSYVTTQADVDAGGVTNIATASSGLTTSLPASKFIASSKTSALTMTKSADMTPVTTAGQTIPYTFKVTNSGNTTLTGALVVNDDKIGALPCATPLAGLAPGAFVQCLANYTVTQADIDFGSVKNNASATLGGATSPTVSVTVPATRTPSLKVAKSSSAPPFTAANTSIIYSYQITNTGNTTIASPIAVNDNKIASFNCAAPGSALLPGVSVTCTATYVTTQADVDAGGVTNTVSVKSGTTTSPTTELTVNSARTPGITIEKSAPATPFTTPGQKITYTYKVTNSGNTTVTSPVSVTDSKIGTFVCSANTAGLLPAAFATCTADYTVQQADLDASNIVNTAFAKSGSLTSPTVTFRVNGVQIAGLTVSKQTTAAGYSFVGEIIAYAFDVSNTGSVSLTSPVSLVDSKIGVVTCPATLLAPVPQANSSFTCNATYAVKQSDIDLGNLVNTASATATTSAGNAVSPTVSVSLPATKLPKLTVDKKIVAPTPAVLDTIGQIITYNYTVTNLGNTTLTSAITVTDDKIPAVNCPAMPTAGLVPSVPTPGLGLTNKLVCSGTYAITQADLDAGSVTNTATSQSGPTVSTPPTVVNRPLDTTSKLTITKTPSRTTFTAANTPIDYIYVVTNAGNTTIAATRPISVADDRVNVTCPPLPGLRRRRSLHARRATSRHKSTWTPVA
jgi:large repetitive protein